MPELSHHIRAYTSLASILAVGLWGIVFFKYQPQTQILIVAAICVSYFAWGIIHHLVDRSFNLKTIVDYLIVSVMGFIVITTFISPSL